MTARLANDVRATKKRMEADYNVHMRVRESFITVGSKVLGEVSSTKHRKNTGRHTVMQVCGSLVTQPQSETHNYS